MCISFLLLLNKLHKLSSLDSIYLLSLGFHRFVVWAQLSCVLCSGSCKTTVKVVAFVALKSLGSSSKLTWLFTALNFFQLLD